MILVTGSSGFIGSHLVDVLRARGEAVLGVDIRPSQWTDWDIDVTCDDQLSTLPWEKIRAVYHLASVVGVPNYLADPMKVIRTVIDGTLGVACMCAYYDIPMVHASTSEIYGRNPKVPWAEDDDRVLGATTTARWSYASAKGVAEHMIDALREKGLKAAIVRFFNVYGPRQAPIYAVSRPLKAILSGERPEIHAPGHQTRCFTYVDDAVRGLIAVMGQNQAFNVGSTVETSIVDLVQKLCFIAEVSFNPRFVPNPYQDDILRRIPDTNRIRALGWQPEVSLKQGLAMTIDWAREAWRVVA